MPNIKRTYDNDNDKYRGDDATYGGLFTFFAEKGVSDDEDDVVDDDAAGLSYIGKAAYDFLKTHHGEHHLECWNVTHGKIVGPLRQTPFNTWDKLDIPKDQPGNDTHDDWFPESMLQVIARTQRWCDVTSLGPPDGKFLTRFAEAVATVAETSRRTGNTIVMRLLFGNIPFMPVNCDAVIKSLTQNIPRDHNLQLWVGAWRRGVSWNHSKIIAVDGRFLHNGGHNLWDGHYLKWDPVHDVSMEACGEVAHDGHLFANTMWKFIEYKQDTIVGRFIDKMPDGLEIGRKSRVTVSEFPEGVSTTFPPVYVKRVPDERRPAGNVPMITMGRYGSLYYWARPSDDAFLAMFDAAQRIVRMSLQDLGPITIPGTKMAVPGCVWPKKYLEAWGRAIYERGVDVEIVVSNPNSIPGGLKPTEANYGNGWTCNDVAAEIIGAIQDQFDDVDDGRLRRMISENLRLCYLKQSTQSNGKFVSGMNQGNHAKFFIIDDISYYVGSQNLYVCDLAEWGIVTDDPGMTQKVLQEYWHPIWQQSFTGKDVNVEEVMDTKDVDRSGEHAANVEAAYLDSKKKKAAKGHHPDMGHSGAVAPSNSPFYTHDPTDKH